MKRHFHRAAKKTSIIFLLGLLRLLGLTRSMSTGIMSVSTDSAVTTRPRRSAVIIGGGPSGLAASLLLEKCGWDDVTIVEKRATNFFESSKAYLYLIDGRGQKCTNALGTIIIIVWLSALLLCDTISGIISDIEFPYDATTSS
jgi:FAD binding domain